MQITLFNSACHKLTSKYFGPYPIVEIIGSVAYKLFLSLEVKIYPTFHISLLKFFLAIPTDVVHPPVTDLASLFFPAPKSILARRMIKKGNKAVAQCLIIWTNLAADFATWETVADLHARFPSFTLENNGVVHQEN
ncbi:uncharacterized protein [Nicotiana tomentosiformis]|uniref:uncharacterized protein n=1 Tax=Nicotiana tomentosiformis TaxID=4098 RepID=UPI00388C63BF